MFLVRRVFKIKAGGGNVQKAARILAKLGKAYEAAGQRSPTRVYWSGGTVPGPANLVYMDWTETEIRSPYREGNVVPEEAVALGRELREFQEDSYIEFYEMVPPQ